MHHRRPRTAYVALHLGAIILGLIAIGLSYWTLISGWQHAYILPQRRQAMFAQFVNAHINDIHPAPSSVDSPWVVTDISFTRKNSAVVVAHNGSRKSALDIVYWVDPSRVHVVQITDITKHPERDAKLALIYYLSALADKNYQLAAERYGGPIERLQRYYQEPASTPALFAAYCTVESPIGACLKYSIVAEEQGNAPMMYRFGVTYAMPDGSLYRAQDATRQFTLWVERQANNAYQVLSLPFDRE